MRLAKAVKEAIIPGRKEEEIAFDCLVYEGTNQIMKLVISRDLLK
jgi:hypothetical protein